MIYNVNFEDVASNIKHINLCKYVSDLNWNLYEGKVRKGIKVYQKEINNKLYQIDIPCEKFSDYNRTIMEVIKTLSIVENKSQEEIIMELINPMSDILRFRLINDSVENGSILFEDAINLFDNSRKVIQNAAMDIVSYKPIYKGRVQDNVQKFIDNCRYGQTEIGSYVISIVCPFVDIDKKGQIQQLSMFTDEQNAAYSITRKVTKKVIESVSCIKKYVDNNEPLEDLIEKGANVSVSFMEALTNIDLEKNDTKLEITAKWAPTIYENKPNSDKVVLSNEYYDPIKAIIDKYKKEEDEELSTIEGKIFELIAKPQLEDRETGKAKIVFIGDDFKAKNISMELDRDNYDIALKAHSRGQTVRAVGKKCGNKMTDVELVILD